MARRLRSGEHASLTAIDLTREIKFLYFMWCRVCQRIAILSLLVAGVAPVAHAGTLPDSVKGIPQERFMEFWSTYMVSTLHYGDEDVPSRIVGFFGEVDSTSESAFNGAIGFLETNRDVFRIHDVQSELVPDTIEYQDNGGRTIVLQQMCQGLKVVNCQLQFAVTPESSMELISGRYLPPAEVSVDPEIDSVTALEIVRDSLAQNSPGADGMAGTLCILPDHKTFRLVWEVARPSSSGGIKRLFPIYVDAHSGAIVSYSGW